MIRKFLSTLPGHVHVIFELPAYLWADHISVVGEWNGWDPTATVMHQNRDGIWRAEIDLPHGCEAEFRYVVDGRWLTDDHADAQVKNPYRSTNSVVIAILPVEKLPVDRRHSQVREGAGASRIRVY